MNQEDMLKAAKLATRLMQDYPKATSDIERLKWIKTANELLKLKVKNTVEIPDPVPPAPEKEESIYLQQVINKTIPDMQDPAVSLRISNILKNATDDKDLIILGQKAVDTYKQAFLLKAKIYSWGKV